MKYLKVFDTKAQQDEFRHGENYIQPHVSCIVDGTSVKYNWLFNNGYDYVDLGLPSGTLWATCNVGTNSPEELGDYYAWGEITPKQEYTWNNYKFGTENNITKYNETDQIYNLKLEDDVANVVMGGGWQIPSFHQWEELFRYTTSEGIEINGVRCVKFISEIDSSKFIILPSGGYKNNSTITWSSSICYWSNYWPDYINNWFNDTNAEAVFFDGDAGYQCSAQYQKYYGMPIRAVIVPEPKNYLQQFWREVGNTNPLPDKILTFDGNSFLWQFDSYTGEIPQYVEDKYSSANFWRVLSNLPGMQYTDASNFSENTINNNIKYLYFLWKIRDDNVYLNHYDPALYYNTYDADGWQGNTSDEWIIKDGDDYYICI